MSNIASHMLQPLTLKKRKSQQNEFKYIWIRSLVKYCCLHFSYNEHGQSSPKHTEVSTLSPALLGKFELRYDDL